VNGYKNSYTYDGNNNQIEALWQDWDGSAWVNSTKHSYTYDVNNNQTGWLWQDWDGSAWVNNHKYSYTYDGNNNQIESLRQNWDGSAWVNYSKQYYTYDGNNNLTEDLWQDWDGSDWVNVDKSIYSYIPTDVRESTGEFNDYSLSNNFPNPFNPTTTIRYTIPSAIATPLERGKQSQLITLKVYDVLGKEVATLVNEEKPSGSYEVTWYAENLPSGVYLYQIIAGNYLESKKMVLIK
jgi:hypothetical protein